MQVYNWNIFKILAVIYWGSTVHRQFTIPGWHRYKGSETQHISMEQEHRQEFRLTEEQSPWDAADSKPGTNHSSNGSGAPDSGQHCEVQAGRRPRGPLPQHSRGPAAGPSSTIVTLRLCTNPWVRKIPWRRKWQAAPVLLPGKSLGQRSLASYSPWGP